MRSAILSEIRATLALAVPLAAANLSQIAMSVIDTVMVGGLGAVPLAAIGLGGSLYFTLFVVCQGVLEAVTPLAAFAIGARDAAAAGRIAGSGLLLAALLAPAMIVALMIVGPILGLIGYDRALTVEIDRFLHAMAWGVPAVLASAVLRSLFAALGRPQIVMIVLACSVPLRVGFDWALIFGHLGVAPLGLVGCGYAVTISHWLTLAAFAGILLLARPGAAALRLHASATELAANIRRIIGLGLPIGGLRALEVGVFACSAALMGLFGADALGAHQIAINCASVTWMVPLGIAQAATVRIAAERGASAALAARRAAAVALLIATGFMSVAAVVLWTAPLSIVSAYVSTSDPANRAMVDFAVQFLAIAALFQVVDGVQVVAAGALRGYQDTKVPMLYAGLGYWGVGFVGGWALAFPLGLGPIGMWSGFVLGLATVAALLTMRLWRQSHMEAANVIPAQSPDQVRGGTHEHGWC
jgi:MATE family multidrug resistance protein